VGVLEGIVQIAADRDLESQPISSAERQLWCAVLDRALQDAMDRIATVSGPHERQKLRQEARDWFLRNGDDFRAACESAGYDPDYFRSRALSMIEPAA
jgi:hypothetical protein